MANETVIRRGLKIQGTLPSGTGDPLLTLDSTTKETGSIPSIDLSAYLSNSLTSTYLLVGNSSNIATPRQITGGVTFSNLGVSSISNDYITNAHINTGAAISYSKLNLQLSVVNNDIAVAAGIAKSKIENGTANRILVNSSLGVFTEASAITAGRLLISDINGIPTHSDVTDTEVSYIEGLNAPVQDQLDDRLSFSSAITPAEGDIIYYTSGAWNSLVAGSDGEVLTLASGLPSWASGASNGLPTGGSTGQYLNKVDGTDYNTQWSTLVLASLTDITANISQVNALATGFYDATSSVQTQLDSKMDDSLTTDNIYVGVAGVATAGTNLPTGITIGSQYIYRTGGTDVTLTDGGTGASLADPGADRILFWDDSAGQVTWLVPNNGLTVSTTNLNLGGTLNANVIFNGGGFDFEIGQSGDRVDDFRVSATNFIALNASNAGITFTSGTQSIGLGSATPITLTAGRQGNSWIGDWTANANNQYHVLLAGGTYTARATVSDTITGVQIKPTLVAAANDQRLVVLDLSATFTLGAFTGLRSNLIYSPNFAVLSTGQISFGSTSSPPTITPVGNTGGTDATGSGIKIEGLLVGTTQTTGVFLGLVNNSLAINSTATGNIVQILMPPGGFAPSSGAYNLRQLYNAPEYNQTGSASGNVIFCEYSPTETVILGTHYGLLMNSATAKHSFGAGLTPTNAIISIGAGTTTLAPLKIISGTNLTSPISGVIEYNNTFHLTNSDATRRHIVTAPNTTKVTAAAPYTNDGYITVNIGGTDFRLMTTA